MLSVQLSMNNTWVSFISRIRITLYQFYNYSTSRQIFFYKSITHMTHKNQPYLFESELFNLVSTIQWKKNKNYPRFSLFNIIEESKLFKLPTAWYQLCKSINPLFSFSFLCEDKYYWSFFFTFWSPKLPISKTIEDFSLYQYLYVLENCLLTTTMLY